MLYLIFQRLSDTLSGDLNKIECRHIMKRCFNRIHGYQRLKPVSHLFNISLLLHVDIVYQYYPAQIPEPYLSAYLKSVYTWKHYIKKYKIKLFLQCK